MYKKNIFKLYVLYIVHNLYFFAKNNWYYENVFEDEENAEFILISDWRCRIRAYRDYLERMYALDDAYARRFVPDDDNLYR